MKKRALISLSVMGAVLFAPLPTLALDDFSFRRVKVPESGSSAPRITVQIDPAEQLARLQAGIEEEKEDPIPVEPRPSTETAGWFWSVISPSISAANPGRLESAVAHLSEAPDPVRAPRMQYMQQLAAAHGTEILRATVGTRVSPALVLAIMMVESAGRADAVSHAGAVGLMQLMPATAARFAVEDRTAPEQSIRGGVAYLDTLMEMFGDDPLLAIAAYNAGEGAVQRAGGVPDYEETRAYVPKVLAAWSVARALCRTPPELATDGCVFSVLAVRS